MGSLSIFDGITDEEKRRLFRCFAPATKVFFDGEIIMYYSRKIDKIGILLDGKAHISSTDPEGRQSILEQFEKNDIFGELFMMPQENSQYFIEADTACDVLFIDYSKIIKMCPSVCPEHSRFISNLIRMTAAKTQSMAHHINILSHRTTRQKLMAYFESEANRARALHTKALHAKALHAKALRAYKKYFTIPMSLSALADYISVDRSAMMRELKKMKEEGIIDDKRIGGKRHYALLNNDVM